MVARLLWAKNASAAGGRKKRAFLGVAVGMSRLIIEPKRFGNRKRADKAGNITEYK